MKLVLRFGLSAIIMLALTACNEKEYKPIPKTADIVVSMNLKEASISFVDISERKEISKWKMEKPYSGGVILPDGDTLLLYGDQLDSADLYSLSTGKYQSSWKTGNGIVNAILLENNTEVVFADQEKNQARFFNLKGKEVASVDAEEKPFTLLEGKEKIFVFNIEAKELTVIDSKTKNKEDSLFIHPFAAGALLREKTGELWVGGHGVGTKAESDIHVYNIDDGKLVKTLSAPIMPINLEEWKNDIFVLSHGSNTLYKISADGEKIQSIQIGANPFEFVFFQNELIVAGYDSNDIYFVKPNNLEIIKKVNVGQGPFQLIVRESIQK